jgi:hypothetical protein
VDIHTVDDGCEPDDLVPEGVTPEMVRAGLEAWGRWEDRHWEIEDGCVGECNVMTLVAQVLAAGLSQIDSRET